MVLETHPAEAILHQFGPSAAGEFFRGAEIDRQRDAGDPAPGRPHQIEHTASAITSGSTHGWGSRFSFDMIGAVSARTGFSKSGRNARTIGSLSIIVVRTLPRVYGVDSDVCPAEFVGQRLRQPPERAVLGRGVMCNPPARLEARPSS